MTDTPRSSPFSSGSRPGGTGPRSTQPTALAQSGIIGRYQILDKIGEGGMGSLYLARDPAIDRLVAIKLLRRGFDTESLRERFAREARAAGRLRHPNIVTIFDVGEHDGDPFIAMEFLAGETVGELIRHNAGLSLSRRLKLLEELCDGLAYAHRAGLVHRDIKPANLMVDAEGVLKILDFGIVRVSDSGMTQAGVLVGTINYMSPEQVLGTGVDHRSDIFSVGLVAYELLSGRQAFPGTMKDGLLRRIPNAEIEPLAGVVPGLDPDVIGMVERALRKDPADRYQELARMRNDLARARQRIEAEEERAAIEAASSSDETALIADAVTTPGVNLDPPSVPPPRTPVPGPTADAERALAEGNYRAALSLAARLAALNPQDRSPGTIVARAEQALLERGRTVESSRPVTPRSDMSPLAMPSDAPQATPASVPAPSTPPATGVGAQHVNYLAIGVAVVALLVAGFAVMTQMDRSDPQPGGSLTDAGQTPSGGPDLEAGGTSEPPAPPGERPAGEGDQAPPAAGGATDDDRPSSTTTPSPSERAAKQPDAPTSGGASRTQPGGRGAAGTPDPRRTQPRGGDPTVRTDLPRAPRREAQPPAQGTTPAPVPEVKSTTPSAGLPGPDGPKPSAPPAPPPAAPAGKPSGTETAPRPSPPPRNPRAEAEAAVDSLLRRYEAAWEALDFAALQRVWETAPGSVQQAMADMRDYAMDITSKDIQVADDGRRATAVCTIAIRFRGGAGSSQRASVVQTFTFQKRGDNWMITGLK